MTPAVIVTLFLLALVIIIIAKTAVVVPQQSAYVVERLGKYSGTLTAGFHILIPFWTSSATALAQRAAYDIPSRSASRRTTSRCTSTVSLHEDHEPERTSYGVMDHEFAISQLAQTALRSEVGKIDSTRRSRNARTSTTWSWPSSTRRPNRGGESLRYEIKNITPPGTSWPPWRNRCAPSGRSARHSRLRGTARRRDQQRRRGQAAGDQGLEAKKQQQINEARTGLRDPGRGSRDRRGSEVRGEYDQQPGRHGGRAAPRGRGVREPIRSLAKASNTLVLPANLADVGSMLALALNVIRQGAPSRSRRPDDLYPAVTDFTKCRFLFQWTAFIARYRAGAGGWPKSASEWTSANRTPRVGGFSPGRAPPRKPGCFQTRCPRRTGSSRGLR